MININKQNILYKTRFYLGSFTWIDFVTFGLLPILWLLYKVFPTPFESENLSFVIAFAWIFFLLLHLFCLESLGYSLRKISLLLNSIINNKVLSVFGFSTLILLILIVVFKMSEFSIHVSDKPLQPSQHPLPASTLILSDNFEDAAEIPLIITMENSELPGNSVRKIYIDSSNAAWIGTDAGLSRLTTDGWVHYSKSNFLINNQINDIDYERTQYGKELWVATDSGLTVATYTDVDGITSATTYNSNNSGMIGNKVRRVLVDPEHNRWIGTDSAINVYKGSDWYSVMEAFDGDGEKFTISDFELTDLEWYDFSNNILITTNGKGILRMSCNEVDGITGASTYGFPWAKNSSDNVFSVAVINDIQWYGTDRGADKHTGSLTKEGWEFYDSDSGLLAATILETFVDSDTNIWFGTESGLSILTKEGWYKYTIEEGLINPVIKTIAEDYKGFVWVGTNGGIERFNNIPGILVEGPSSIAEIRNNLTLDFDFYPNPATTHINLKPGKNSSEQSVQVQIFNLQGVKFFEIKDFTTHELLPVDLEANGIGEGVWVIKVTQGNMSVSKTLIVTK